MSEERLSQLLRFLKDDPNDSFTLYALALEYMNSDETKALFYFEKLLNEQEEYVPTYYHAAKLYELLEESEKARATYEKGLQMSQKKQDQHAYNELKKAYDQFLFEEDL